MTARRSGEQVEQVAGGDHMFATGRGLAEIIVSE